jgi:hypothetical protein
MAARTSIYHTSSYKSNIELKELLQRDVGISKMSYTIYHRGILAYKPNVRERIEVRTVFTCLFLLAYMPEPILIFLSLKP